MIYVMWCFPGSGHKNMICSSYETLPDHINSFLFNLTLILSLPNLNVLIYSVSHDHMGRTCHREELWLSSFCLFSCEWLEVMWLISSNSFRGRPVFHKKLQVLIRSHQPDWTEQQDVEFIWVTSHELSLSDDGSVFVSVANNISAFI